MERWEKTYTSDVDVYEALGAAGDAEGRVLPRLLAGFSVRGKTVLEVGCGTGGYAQALAPLTRAYYALDISAPMLGLARRPCAGVGNLAFLRANAEAIPLRDGSVDAAFGTWAIGAIWPPDARERALGEVHRVVEPGGEVWAVENHWESAFMDMRGDEEQAWDHQTRLWYESHGYEIFDTVDTAFVFPTLAEARRVLGFIFGEKALRYLDAHPSPRLEHTAMIVHKTLDR